MKYIGIIFSILLVYGCKSARVASVYDSNLENKVYKIERMKVKGVPYMFNVNTDSVFFLRFGKVKQEKNVGLRGAFYISSKVNDVTSPFYCQPPFYGFYKLEKDRTLSHVISFGWYNHRSYNPAFNSEYGRVFRSLFYMKGEYRFDKEKLLIIRKSEIGDADTVALIK